MFGVGPSAHLIEEHPARAVALQLLLDDFLQRPNISRQCRYRCIQEAFAAFSARPRDHFSPMGAISVVTMTMIMTAEKVASSNTPSPRPMLDRHPG